MSKDRIFTSYDPRLSYEENEAQGPFGVFGDDREYHTMGEPEYDFLGDKVHLPLGIPAGPLLNSRFVIGALRHGWDIATYKTVRSVPHTSHPAPNLVRVEIPGELTDDLRRDGVQATKEPSRLLNTANSFGVPSVSPDVWQPDVARVVDFIKARHDQSFIVSVQGTAKGDGDAKAFVQDSARVAVLAEEAGATIVEKNASCPNEGSDALLCFDVSTSAHVAEKTREILRPTTRYLMKLAYMADDVYLRRFVGEVGRYVDGFVFINTLASRVIEQDGQQYFPGSGRAVAGVSGDVARPHGLDMVARMIRAREEAGLSFAIIGVGGVTRPEHYMQYRSAGALAVMSAAGSIWNNDLALETKLALGQSVRIS
jgi:dihydroorotate dehydrogenase (NAD+) catalytic subunit